MVWNLIISWSIVLLGFAASCGQEYAETSFRQPATQAESTSSSEDLSSEHPVEISTTGELLIPNQIKSAWDGKTSLGNSIYQVKAVD